MNDNQKMTVEQIKAQTAELNEKFGALLEGQCTEVGIKSLVWMLANVVAATVKPENMPEAVIHIIGDFMKALSILSDDDDEMPSDSIH